MLERDSDKEEIRPEEDERGGDGTSSHQHLTQNGLQECQSQPYNISHTHLDWKRNFAATGSLHFNGKPVFSKKGFQNLKESQIDYTIRNNLRVDPRIQAYIINYAHQNGFLNVAETMAKPIIFSRTNAIFICQKNHYDFIENEDGSVTLVEHFFIDSYNDLEKGGKIVSSPTGRPLLIGIATSRIYLDEQEEVKHDLIDDRVLVTDKLGEKLAFITDDEGEQKSIFGEGTRIEKIYDTPVEEIEEELKQEVASQVVIHDRKDLPKGFLSSRPVQFLKNHWGKILVGGVVAAGLVVGGIFTGGAVPAIAAGVAGALGVSTLAGGLIGVGAIAGGAAVFGAAATGVAVSQTPESGGVKGFFKNHWKAIAIGAVIGAFVVGAVVAGLFTFGVGTAVFGAIGAGVGAGVALFGVKIAAGVGIGIGAAAVAKGAIVTGAVAGAAIGTALDLRKQSTQAKLLSAMQQQQPRSRKGKEKEEKENPIIIGEAGPDISHDEDLPKEKPSLLSRFGSVFRWGRTNPSGASEGRQSDLTSSNRPSTSGSSDEPPKNNHRSNI